MEYNTIIITFILIVIPLILLIILYKNYVYNYCKNDMKCIKDKLIDNLNNLNNKLKTMYVSEEIKKDDEIEGFFSGFGNWFSGSNPSNLPISPQSDNSIILEKKINDSMITSKNFPPKDLNGSNDEFKDSNNEELLSSIGVKPNIPEKAIFDKTKLIHPKDSINFDEKKLIHPKDSVNFDKTSNVEVQPKIDVKSLLGSCQFYNDKCPDNHYELGNFSVEGVSNGSSLRCGNVQNTKPAHAIAQIKNNSVYEIHITNQGHGFNPDKPPKVSIEGGKGNGATAEAVIGDDGFLKLVKIINPGYNYTETPIVLIDAPYMNSSCHLCCEGNIGSLHNSPN